MRVLSERKLGPHLGGKAYRAKQKEGHYGVMDTNHTPNLLHRGNTSGNPPIPDDIPSLSVLTQL